VSPSARQVLAGEAPDWVQALAYSVFVLVSVSMVIGFAAFLIAGESAAALVIAGAVGLIVATLYFTRARRWVRVLEEYVHLAATRLGREVPEVRASLYAHRGPAWQTLMMTHAVLLLALCVPLLFSGGALLNRQAAEFERSMAASDLSTGSHTASNLELVEQYERGETRAWTAVGVFLVCWVIFTWLALTRSKSRVARLLRRAARCDASRDELIEAAVTEAVDGRCLLPNKRFQLTRHGVGYEEKS